MGKYLNNLALKQGYNSVLPEGAKVPKDYKLSLLDKLLWMFLK